MADTLKVLGQSNPLAATLTDIYTVPGSTSVTGSSITVANRSSTATSFRISIAVAGAVDSDEQYIYYDIAIPGNETFTATLGITLAATDVVRVLATLATLSFNLFGVEVT
ncbi:MAG: hypothetical protein E2O29_02005 [Deltaproteobacteria bacterium]|nr:MAG: hypothetical protein E2O29_02005 [Deltaproteobacteria bacterium]